MATYTFESFIKEIHTIEIPAIQRDYVQGRGFTIEEQDKREAFVNKLIEAIANDNSEPCHLEFIYGAENKMSGCFIPLDGQQRLTTLFLLHWVVWNMSSNEAKKVHPLDLIKGLKYETRISSTYFCEYIITKELLQVDDIKSLGEKLKKQPWFSEDWYYDPTIMAMISMIDFIENSLRDYPEEQISLMLAKLCSEKNVISFDELNIKDYDLTDSLYIKMNARGKQLTPFENWKSDFIKFLETEFGDEKYDKADENRPGLKSFSYKDYFCHSIEHQWTDLFWTYLKDDYLNLDEEQQQKQYPCIDKMFMNLFDFLCLYHYYVHEEEKNIPDYTQIKASVKRKIWQKKDFVDFLFGTLDSLCRIEHSTFFDELFYISDKELPENNNNCKVRLFRTKQCNLFKLCVDKGSSMELTDLLLFFALLNYCNENNLHAVDDSLKSFMRNVRNYFESEIQKINTRTTVQLNLRVSEFKKYDSKIKELAKEKHPLLSEEECIIDDCAITHGNNKVFNDAIKKYNSQAVARALKAFCDAEPEDRIRVLLACGFKGTYLSDCIGRKRYFFGNKDKWDVLFISDENQLSRCFAYFTSKIAEKKDISTIINEAKQRITSSDGFMYYMLKYDVFLNANDAQHHFAIKGEKNDVDWIALGSYSSNPGTAYHTDPLAASVAKELVNIFSGINLALYKQYSGKCALSIVKDKTHWEKLFSVISRKDGWHILEGSQLLTEDMKSKFNIQKIIDNKKTVFLIPTDENVDKVQICIELMKSIYNSISSCSLSSPTPPIT